MSTVLVVDDCPIHCRMIGVLLIKAGIEVIQAADGIEAQEQIRAHCPDLVIMDVVMPRMNGYDLCRWVKNNLETKNVPIVMCSTKNEAFDHYWGMKQGIDAYIAKPFNPGEMVDTIQQLLRQK
ncbi:response regulator transcription factor [Leptolyngbya sp. FACHB-261]|uniref:response regulator transcription factor n=1 Tax=Leptolyngbya sp. FACHB-261 TaxID=2692806 RepID=UPI001682DC5B|nr:response regulator [Leptolyngbya sp. FACHB-261]MBD2104896.1 response regulator [Leptolyngbya sp. FACHB-261]